MAKIKWELVLIIFQYKVYRAFHSLHVHLSLVSALVCINQIKSIFKYKRMQVQYYTYLLGLVATIKCKDNIIRKIDTVEYL